MKHLSVYAVYAWAYHVIVRKNTGLTASYFWSSGHFSQNNFLRKKLYKMYPFRKTAKIICVWETSYCKYAYILRYLQLKFSWPPISRSIEAHYIRIISLCFKYYLLFPKKHFQQYEKESKVRNFSLLYIRRRVIAFTCKSFWHKDSSIFVVVWTLIYF